MSLTGCIVVSRPDDGPASPYLSRGEMDMVTPVYVTAYPGVYFYHRYSPRCDCILVVREYDGMWYDHTGRHVHVGHWAPARPSARAIHGYKGFYSEHRKHLHPIPLVGSPHAVPPVHPGSSPPARPPYARPHAPENLQPAATQDGRMRHASPPTQAAPVTPAARPQRVPQEKLEPKQKECPSDNPDCGINGRARSGAI